MVLMEEKRTHVEHAADAGLILADVDPEVRWVWWLT
jgi:hypothetical protein